MYQREAFVKNVQQICLSPELAASSMQVFRFIVFSTVQSCINVLSIPMVSLQFEKKIAENFRIFLLQFVMTLKFRQEDV